MAAFFSSLTSIALFVSLIISSTRAAPSPSPEVGYRRATQNSRRVAGGLVVETFNPPSTFETFKDGIDHPLSTRAEPNLKEDTIAFVGDRLKIAPAMVTYRSGSDGEFSRIAYVRQASNGIPFANAVANVAFNEDNKIVAFGSSFIKPKKIADRTPKIPLEEAIDVAQTKLNGTFDEHPPTLEYLVKQDNTVALTHVMQIHNEEMATYYRAFVDAHSGDLISIVDYVAEASYLVIPIQKKNPNDGFETVVDPANTVASPNGWHQIAGITYPASMGNNVLAGIFPPGVTAPTSSAPLNFIWQYNPLLQPYEGVNSGAGVTNAFYLANTVHDIAYIYGFTEANFNFQQENFGRGGFGADHVVVSVQDTSNVNNANFVTPPEGQSGIMRIYPWTNSVPFRDGALENDIVVHEYTHGITNRLTGGGSGTCLQTPEAAGLGEGWSDAFASWTEKTSAAVPDYYMVQWAANKPGGYRRFPYSTSRLVNPLLYSDLLLLNEPHDVGEVWANILHNVYALLVQTSGFSPTARTNASGNAGNVVFLHLFIDALQLQPCNPTFLNARDAWLAADRIRYGGAHECVLWAAFASRGMGVGAIPFINSFVTPVGQQC